MTYEEAIEYLVPINIWREPVPLPKRSKHGWYVWCQHGHHSFDEVAEALDHMARLSRGKRSDMCMLRIHEKDMGPILERHQSRWEAKWKSDDRMIHALLNR